MANLNELDELLESAGELRKAIWGNFGLLDEEQPRNQLQEDSDRLNSMLQSDNPEELWAAKQEAENLGLEGLAYRLRSRSLDKLVKRIVDQESTQEEIGQEDSE